MAKISMLGSLRVGRAFSTVVRVSLWTWERCTDRPVSRQYDHPRDLWRNAKEGAERTTGGIQSPTASFTFKMLGFLVGDEDLHVVEVALTVIAPWSREDFFGIWVASLLFGHFGGQL